MIGNIPANVTEIVKSLPQLPKMLVNEVKDVADGFADDLEENRQQNMNPLQSVLSLPGVRMIPGTYVAGQLSRGTEGIKELGRNPVMAGLDVLPYAGKAAKGTKVAKGYANLVESGLNETRSIVPKQPIRLALTQRLTPDGLQKLNAGVPLAEIDFRPTRLGEVTQRLGLSKPGQRLSEMFGPQASEVSRLEIMMDQSVAQRAVDPTDVIGGKAKDFVERAFNPKLAMEQTGVSLERQAELVKIATTEPKTISTLPANEQAFLKDVRDTTEFLGKYAEQNKLGLGTYRGEFFTDDQVKTFMLAEERVAKRVGTYMTARHQPRVKPDGTVIPAPMDLLANADARWASIKGLIDSGDIKGASVKANRLRNYNAAAIDGITDKGVAKVIDDLNKAAKSQRVLEQMIVRTPPARFNDMIFRRASEKYLTDLNTRGLFKDVDAVRKFFNEGMIEDIPGWDWQEFSKFRRSTARSWEAMKAAGEDPIFLSRVTKAQAESIRYPHINEKIPTMHQAKMQVSDISPSIKDFNISVSHQAMEILKREAAQEFADTIQTRFGFSDADARAMVRDKAIENAQYNPTSKFLEERADLMPKHLVPYDPQKHAPFSGLMTPKPNETIYIPRSVARVLEQMNSEGMMNLRSFSDPLTKAWRISLLPLSPRWHLYNIVGGMIMLTNETGPGALKYLKDGYDIAKAAKNAEPLPVPVAKEVKLVLGSTGRIEAEMAFRSGRTMRRFFDESQAARLAKGVIKKSFDFNQFFDDMYRSTAYLYGTDKALAKGLTQQGAEMAGVNLARKVLQDTAGLTPFERSILRQIFPFYSWNSHVVRYAMKFPFDHPIRAALIGGISRQALEDIGEGGTTSMLDTLSFGSKDDEGNQYGVRAASFNPFNDLGNFFSLAGWLGATSPLISTALGQMGIDTQSGSAELYPTLRYDAETGRMTTVKDNPVTALAMNTLPHAQFISNITQSNAEFRQLMKSDPDAARRMLLSNVGIPVLTAKVNPFERGYNPAEKYVSAEIKRQELNTKILSEYLREGNLAGLSELGIPAETIQNLRQQAESGQLAQYQPAVVREQMGL